MASSIPALAHHHKAFIRHVNGDMDLVESIHYFFIQLAIDLTSHTVIMSSAKAESTSKR
jgi:hypothetical protein